MYVCCWAIRSFVGSVARQRPVGNKGVVISEGPLPREHLSLNNNHTSPVKKNQIQNTGGAISTGVKRARRKR
jgi:hypothetical protein